MGSGIIEETIKYEETGKKKATHFVIYNKRNLRYFIDLRKGKKLLVNSLSSYSLRHKLLIYIIKYMPYRMIKILKLGFFVEAQLAKDISEFINNNNKDILNWNVIVGTYDDKQKIVIQVLNEKYEIIYYKIGNMGSNKQMKKEIQYLNNKKTYSRFNLPEIIYNQLLDNSNKFNIMATREFKGNKVDPILTNDIYMIFKEIFESNDNKEVNGINYGFSHGDFAPWNLKKTRDGYIVFDWEHYGIRFYGFDLIHFVFQIEHKLNNKSKEDALRSSIKQVQQVDNILCGIDNKMLEELYLQERYKIYGDNI